MSTGFKHDRLARKTPAALAELLSIGPDEVAVRSDISVEADFVISAVGQTLVIEFKMSTGAALIAAAAKRVKELARQIRGGAVPLLAVPFMGEVGRRLCEEEGVSWLDLSGNARIIAPGIRVIIDGQPNRFRVVGRPPNLFAPKSSRIVRWLLLHPNTTFSQREIARATEMDEGFVSRLVSRLEAEGYVVRVGVDDGSAGIRRPGRPYLRVRDPGLLLDAWQAAYRFSGHNLHQGHVAARSGEALLRFVADTLKARHIEYAATGLAAAWVLTRFTAFRTTTVYLTDDPPQPLLDALSFREDPRGANLWLVVPNDVGVFHGAVEKDNIRCVHPVQVYLDLKEHPERSSEAAKGLRSEFLTRRRDG
ncbi:MAG: type IV toxin-antitoxin system AbiEi family antitoxin [Thermodesulfobacteriota bacterium]